MSEDLDPRMKSPIISGSKKGVGDRRMQAILDAMPKGTGIREGLDQLAEVDPVIWTMYYRKLRGHRMTFDMAHLLTPKALAASRKEFRTNKEFQSYKKITTLRHRPFMIEPLRDQHPHKVYKKGRQIGVSELSLTEAIWFLWANDGTKLIYCVPDDAEILTRSGWKLWHEVGEGDETLTLGLGDYKTQWEPLLSVETFDYDGELLNISGFHCTPDHRWPLVTENGREVLLAKDIKQGQVLTTLHAPDGDYSEHSKVKSFGWTHLGDSKQYKGTVWCPCTPSKTWLMRYKGEVVFTHNTFPRDTQLKDFANTRISEALMETPRMRGIPGIPNQVYLKKLGNSHMVLRSAWDSNLGEGVDADVVILDEKDRMKQGVDIAFRESLSASRFGYLREVSTPTLPGKGVDASWRVSDQRLWFVKCTKCGLKQPIQWPENIIQKKHVKLGQKELKDGTYEYACRKEKCRGPLDRLHGEWVATYPNITKTRGYHMPQTIANWISATEVMQKKINYKFLQLWMNYVLGEVSKGENMLLTDADFAMADAGHELVFRRTPDWVHISVGIDWGHQNWVTVYGHNVNGRIYVINAGVFEDDASEELRSVKAIESFIAPLQPDIIVADAGYGKDRNAYLLRKFGAGRFYSCWYNPSNKGSRTFTPVWSSPELARLLVDRTMTLKVLCRAIKDREFGLPSMETEIIHLLVQHFKNLSPLKEEDEDGDIVETIAASGDDHLVHSSAYGYLGMTYLLNTNTFSFDFV